MELLKEKILKEGRVIGEHILKVDHFLNHQLDVSLLNAIGRAFKERFGGEEVTKILTAEVSGIAIAAITAQYFDVPVVFARKTSSLNLDKETYEGSVYSYTKQQLYKFRVSRHYLPENEKVLIIDDFLANGEAIKGLCEIVASARATLVGAGVVIEKHFQGGGNKLREKGLNVQALVSIASLTKGQITFLQ